MLAGCSFLLLAGCRTARMPVPAALATAERYAVEGRQGLKVGEQLRFGPFEAREIDRTWVRGGDLEVVGLEFNRRLQRYAFVLQGGAAERWAVSCETTLRRRIIDGEDIQTTLRDRSKLDCTLEGGRAERWTLSLSDRRDQPLAGTLSSGATDLAVRGTKKLAGGLPAESTTGYEIGMGDQPVAAVEVIGDGAVWLTQTDGVPRDVLAAVAAALLLLEDLRAHLPAA